MLDNNIENEQMGNISCEGMQIKSKKILMIVTNTDHMDQKHKTGVTFDEFAIPYTDFIEQGYEVTVASPQGGVSPIDPASESFINDLKWKDAKEALFHTQKLDAIDYSIYDAIVLPGGHGAMYDIATSNTLGEIILYFSANSKLIAAICHGAAGFLTAVKDDNPFVSGRKLTCFSNEEEIAHKKDKLVPFFLEDALKEQRAFYIEKSVGAINVIEDDNLITAQNRESTKSFSNTIIKYLNKEIPSSCGQDNN